MTNVLCILIYIPFFVMSASLWIASLMREGSQAFLRCCKWFYFLLTCWFASEMLFYALPNPVGVRLVFDVKLIFVAFLPIATFFLTAAFFRFDDKLPRWLFAGLCIVPAVTSLLAVTTLWHPLLAAEMTVRAISPLTYATMVRAPWYYVHMVHCQVLNLATAAVIFYRYRTLPHAYRGGTILLFAGVSVYFFCTVIETFGFDGGNVLDFNLIGTSIAGLFYYLVTLVSGRIDCLHIDNRRIFHSIDEAVFVLDTSGRILDKNYAALRLMKEQGCDRKAATLADLLADMTRRRLLTRRISEYKSAEDLCFLGESSPRIFQMRSQPMLDRRRIPVGHYAILTEITNDHLFLERLRETAGVDPLTGVINRYGYQRALRDYDRQDNLPLSIVFGDINGLKAINDEYGYYEGDLWIKIVAESLTACCPASGIVARVGGDEFALIAPRCDAAAAEELIETIQQALVKFQKPASRPVIALGVATKVSFLENINALVDEADVRMYGNKGVHVRRNQSGEEEQPCGT